MIHYSYCPVCNSKAISKAISVKDYTVSNELFEIWKCNDCSFMFTQNVPEQENIGRYYKAESYISHSDTQKGFINKLYHTVRKRTLASKLVLIQKETAKTNGKILDVGCGTGAFLNTMRAGGWQITGLEPDEFARKNANSLYNIEPLPSPAIFDLADSTFDAITAWHVMEHVHQLHEYVDRLKALLKNDGKIFIAVPNYTSEDAYRYKEHWAAYDVPRHLYHFSPKSMKVLMDMHGMKVIASEPMWFDSFYVSMLSEQYKNGKSNNIGAFFSGLKSNLKAYSDNEKCSSVIYIISKK